MTVVVAVALAVLALAGTLAVLAALRGPGLADRAVGLDTAVSVVVAGLAVGAVGTGRAVFADIAVVLALLGFLTTVTVARFIGRRGL